ncbi:neuronal acetylcholine receptor subunit alpha-9-like [Lampris incognitus]|uniref:neuronal acetylcholine receptor subunit alpha-9-like n=1 Tax=Lampris incognitus TaxID=2546036 RepID=UPI0024B62A6B|nr:neuronal acetylcholine receptor subunit alpha-9-like [Lampris incognitus]
MGIQRNDLLQECWNRPKPYPRYCRNTRPLVTTWQDIYVFESIHKVLHPLQEFTDALSGEEYVSISYLKPVLHLLATSVLAEDDEDTDLSRSIKTKVLTYLSDKYSDSDTTERLDVISFQDPRFKKQYISADYIPAIKTRLKTEMEWSARLSLGAHGRYAQKLLNDLFSNYTSALRPVEDTDHIINVTLQITLSQIIDMDERNQILTTYLWIRQVWTDAYLTWKKEDYDGLDTIRIPSSYVWRPDIVLYNSADDQFSSSMETNVVIRNDGQIMWDQPAITKSSCSVDVAFFPFDLQQCRLTFGSWTHNGNQMDLVNALDSADLADFVPNVEWEVEGMPSKKNIILYGCCSEPYPDITYTLHLKRRASFYIFNLLIPCMMISFLAPLGFYLPADSGEKVSLGVTVLLALTVFQLLVAESMPPSESVPLIGKYYIATMTMITASTALTIFIMNIHHCGPEARPVPEWAQKFILHYLAQICFVYEVGENCVGVNSAKTQTPLQEDFEAALESNNPRGMNWDVNGKTWGGQREKRVGEPVVEERLKPGEIYSEQADWKQDLFVSIDHSEEEGATGGCRIKEQESRSTCESGAGEDEGKGIGPGEQGGGEVEGKKILLGAQCVCQHEGLQRNIEYIANCYQDQRTTQIRIGEWRKVAKVMDRFFMWLFFIMVFLMSLLIMGKAI